MKYAAIIQANALVLFSPFSHFSGASIVYRQISVIFARQFRKETMEEKLELLRAKVEKSVGRTMKTPRDFDFLVARAYALTKVHISPTTLKRLWGYLKSEQGHTPQVHTLNILAQVAGHKDWATFAQAAEMHAESDFINNECLSASALIKGDRVRLLWAPDRDVTIRYEGLDMFTVVESVNSKLSQGDTFHCNHFINGEPLHLHCLVHEGGSPTNYVCGRINGVTFRKI